MSDLREVVLYHLREIESIILDPSKTLSPATKHAEFLHELLMVAAIQEERHQIATGTVINLGRNPQIKADLQFVEVNDLVRMTEQEVRNAYPVLAAALDQIGWIVPVAPHRHPSWPCREEDS